MSENDFLNKVLIEVYNANLSKSELDNMTIDDKKEYIREYLEKRGNI